MPGVGLDREFLHRCCVQVSSTLSDGAVVAAEVQHVLRFVREHARAFPGEIARALVWRVVDTDDDTIDDRLGAWSVLNAVLTECADTKQPLSCTAVAEKINLFLPYLIRHRWYVAGSSMAAATSITTTKNMTTAAGASRGGALGVHSKVVPASLVTGGANDLRASDVRKDREMQSSYRAIMNAWKAVWRPDVYQRFKDAVRQAERGENPLSPAELAYVNIPTTFRDSLWRLRRRNPRPSTALHVLSCYGWAPAPSQAQDRVTNGGANGHGTNNDFASRCAVVPATIAEVDALDPVAHPRVRQWMRRLVESRGGCRLCDVWHHEEARCPCETPFFRASAESSSDAAGGQFIRRRRCVAERPVMSYLEAVERLFRYGIRLPLSAEKALDRVVKLIMEETPCEEFLDAFDAVRGAVTGPRERHALWIHAGYNIMPSRTVFEKPSDEGLSPTMEKAERHFKLNRRFREWDQLLGSVDVLDYQFRRAELPAPWPHNIKEIRDTKSFFFCLIDGSYTAEYSPQAYARCPEDVLSLRPVKDVLCPICLEPFHAAAHCTKGTELWDYAVARNALEEHNLINMKYPEDRHLLDNALRSINEDERKAKEFRKNELQLAVKIVHEGRVPYCKACNVMGHSIKRCEETARRTFKRNDLREVDVRLNSQLVQRRIKHLRENGDEREERQLTEAWELLVKNHTYPDSFLTAIHELEDARIPLAAARYSTDAVQGFLLFIKSNDLLQHLQPLRSERFPDVCLFCDSYHHGMELCDRADAEERGFLSELRRHGLTLWQYLRAPELYDERFPTDFAKGRHTVVRLARQFDEDYSSGGIARARFLEDNGLNTQYEDPTLTAAAKAAGRNSSGSAKAAAGGASAAGANGSAVGGSQRSVFGSSPYGASFSRLVLRPAGDEDKDEDEDEDRASGQNGGAPSDHAGLSSTMGRDQWPTPGGPAAGTGGKRGRDDGEAERGDEDPSGGSGEEEGEEGDGRYALQRRRLEEMEA